MLIKTAIIYFFDLPFLPIVTGLLPSALLPPGDKECDAAASKPPLSSSCWPAGGGERLMGPGESELKHAALTGRRGKADVAWWQGRGENGMPIISDEMPVKWCAS